MDFFYRLYANCGKSLHTFVPLAVFGEWQTLRPLKRASVDFEKMGEPLQKLNI